MAEENRAKRTTFEDMMFTLFALYLVAQILNRIPILLEEKFGIDVGGGGTSVLVAQAGLTADTPLGTRVSMPSGGSFFSEPGGSGDAVGAFAPGTSLVVRDGPVEDAEGNRWWLVEDPRTGKTGWVPESALVKEGMGGIGASTPLGTAARALVSAPLWSTAAGAVQAGVMKVGEWGTLKDGPVVKDGVRWWLFDRRDSAEDGWVPESALTLFSEKGWREGSAVVGARDADLYARAGGGDITGFLSEGEKARVRGGPVLVGGTYWWLVETPSGETGWVPEDALESGGATGFVRNFLGTLLIIGGIITVVLLAGIVYVTVRTNQIRAREAARIRAAIPQKLKPKRNERWDTVLEHVSSTNPNDWRLAIIEADVMLDEIVTKMGYHGNSLGEKLKQVARGDMKTLDAAWEAHKVRNQIAHEGSDYILTQREARRVIELYGLVFEEFKYIE